jgi:hypothetical protein
MTDLNPEASAGTPAWWLAHERGLGPDWPSTPAPSGGETVTDDEDVVRRLRAYRLDHPTRRVLLSPDEVDALLAARAAQPKGCGAPDCATHGHLAAQPGTPIDVDRLNREHPLD